MKRFHAGRLVQQAHYKTFQPSLIHRAWELDNMELIQLLGQADRELGRLDMHSEYIPDIDLFVRMHVLKEATQSSRIEGTQTNIDEALRRRADVALEKRYDWEEVQNYVSAMNKAIDRLETLPFSGRLIREAHAILMHGVRGQHKMPGEFRRSQNWIGGATINDAVFVPPAHTSINELMSDLEAFVHDEQRYFPELLKIAIVHYQFETIHPFLDGNGRIGRLMITLYLVSQGILKRPVLYLSDFFERNRALYYDNLMLAKCLRCAPAKTGQAKRWRRCKHFCESRDQGAPRNRGAARQCHNRARCCRHAAHPHRSRQGPDSRQIAQLPTGRVCAGREGVRRRRRAGRLLVLRHSIESRSSNSEPREIQPRA